MVHRGHRGQRGSRESFYTDQNQALEQSLVTQCNNRDYIVFCFFLSHQFFLMLAQMSYYTSIMLIMLLAPIMLKIMPA